MSEKKLKNATEPPKRYFGLHMSEGIAEYKEIGTDPLVILINESTIKKMDPSFEGRPVYVKHVEEVDLRNIQMEADGYVVKSFFNKADGKHWVEFLVVSDRGHEAIRNGWRLSNAYMPKSFGPGGFWHGAEYQKEVTMGEYEHLAIVPNPRYDESVVYTPEDFKAYNERKEQELKKFANSKGERSVLSFFKKSKVENQDLENLTVVLPKSKREVTISQLINDVDEMEAIKSVNKPEKMQSDADAERKPKEEKGEKVVPEVEDAGSHVMANLDHHVMVGEEKMKLNDLVAKHLKLNEDYSAMKMNMESKAPQAGKEEGHKSVEEAEAAEKSAESKKANDEMPDKEAVADKPDDFEKTQNSKESLWFDVLKNAPQTAIREQATKIDLDKVSRGKARYGSN
jgi:hypothetical protein